MVIFVPVGCDFTPPIECTTGKETVDMTTYARWWNEDRFDAGKSTTYAVAQSFAYYTDEILALKKWKKSANQTPRPFHPTPYWTGYYASRPENKILHFRATNALIAAEIFGVLADSAAAADLSDWKQAAQERIKNIRRGWIDLVPSTHHDYITGTAEGFDQTNPVYPDEQVPLLWNAVYKGEQQRGAALQQLAASVKLGSRETLGNDSTKRLPVVVANPLGWDRSGVVELDSLPWGEINSIEPPAESQFVQKTAEDSLLFVSAAPALGYATQLLNMGDPDTSLPKGASIQPGGTGFKLSNGSLTAVIELVTNSNGEKDWMITRFSTAGSTASVFAGPANGVQFYSDAGNIYNFGNENFNGDMDNRLPMELLKVTLSNQKAEVLESGPLRVRLRTTVTATSKEGPVEIVREHALYLGDPHLRVRATGAAPPVPEPPTFDWGFSIGVDFPMSAAPKTLTYGTGYHWDDAPPTQGWTDPTVTGTWLQPVFQVAHDFVMPGPASAASVPFAIYHDSITCCWSNYHEKKTLLGILWRNTPSPNFGRGARGVRHLDAHTPVRYSDWFGLGLCFHRCAAARIAGAAATTGSRAGFFRY